MSRAALDIRPLTPATWPDLVDLFERRGPRGGHRNVPAYGCWCMYWRDRTLEHGEPKKRALEQLARSGREPGLVAYEGREAVGWASVSPREEFRALLSSPQYRPRDDDAGVWSLVCFVVDRPGRRRGVAAALRDAAFAHACARGATALEAYPHRSNRSDYMGHVELFSAGGFEVVREAAKRAIVRRSCG